MSNAPATRAVAGPVPDGGIDQHLAKRTKHFLHLGLFVWEDVGRIHGMNGHSAVHLENQKVSIGSLTAIDTDILQVQPPGDGEQGILMAAREILVEGRKEPLLFGALGNALPHARTHVVHDPMIGDGHVAGIGAPVDQNDAILSELAIRPAILHIAGYIE